jgi:hypothetical protein
MGRGGIEYELLHFMPGGGTLVDVYLQFGREIKAFRPSERPE